MLKQFLHHRAFSEGRATSQEKEHGAAERVEIAADVGIPRVPGLLRRDVVEGSERHSADGELGIACHLVEPRKAHVDDPGAAGRRDDDIGWLDVTMNDVSLGGMLEGLGHLNGHIDGPARIERPLFPNEVTKIDTFDVLQHDVMPALVAADRVNPTDVFMVEPGCRLRFDPEPPKVLLIIRLVAGKNLDRHRAMEGCVERLEDGSHATAADKAIEAIGPKHRAFEDTTDVIGRTPRLGGAWRGRAAGPDRSGFRLRR